MTTLDSSKYSTENAHIVYSNFNGAVCMNFPKSHLDLLSDDVKAFLYLATIRRDGSPQLTPIWFDVEGEYIRINTSIGRAKERNMRANPNVAIVIQDPDQPYRYLGIRGIIASHTTEGADEHINKLSLKYNNKPWKSAPGQQRIIFRIKPTSFNAYN